jgi:drug/metabolite transporter (DMT)-like permease
MELGRIVSLVVAGILATAVSLYIESKIRKRKWRAKILMPVRSPILRLLIAIAMGIAAAFIAQPWTPPPDGWPMWKAALFIGLCFFGMWGALSVRYWAYKKIQEKQENRAGNDSE